MQNSGEIELSWIFKVLRRWIWVIVGCTLVAGFAVLIITQMMTPTYEASSTLMIEPAKDSGISDYNLIIAAERLALTYSQMVESQPVLDELIARLGLKDSEKLKEHIKAEPIQDTQLIRLTATDSSPQQAALLANTTAEILTQYIQDLQVERYQTILESMQKQLDEISIQTNETQSQIDALSETQTKSEVDLARQESLMAATREDLKTLQLNYQNFLLKLGELKNSINIVEEANVPENSVSAPYYATALFLLPDEGRAQTYSQMMTGRAIMETTINQLGLSENPDELAKKVSAEPIKGTQLVRLSVRDADPARATKIADGIAKAFIIQAQDLLTEPYTNQVNETQKKIDDDNTKIDQMQTEIETLSGEVGRVQNEQTRLTTLLSEYRSEYRLLQQKYEDFRLTSVQAADAVVVTEPARVPEKPAQNRFLFIALASFIGLAIGVAAAFLLESLDDTIKTSEDVSKKLGLSIIGNIGFLSKKDLGLVVIKQPRSPVAEAFRVLATNIRFASLDKPLHTLLVSSPRPLEGKTLITSNLAAAISQTENSVVVVDADLRLPKLHKYFDIEPGAGLTESILNNSIDGNLRTITSERLSILTSGDIPPNPTEVVGSLRMQKILEELKEKADVVVLDSPPLLISADSKTLATEVDGVLLVVRAGSTTVQTAREAIESLRQVKANILGVVLNAEPLHKDEYYYHQYHEGKTGPATRLRQWMKNFRSKIRQVPEKK